jgi:hypothetical protein
MCFQFEHIFSIKHFTDCNGYSLKKGGNWFSYSFGNSHKGNGDKNTHGEPD